MKAMVLAAGLGRRMGDSAARRPKPLLAIRDETLIGRHLGRLARSGIEEVVVNLSRDGELIRAELGDGRRWGLSIEYSAEGETPLETGGGIINALPRLGTEPFLLVNADVFTDFDFATLIAGPVQRTLVLVPNPAHHPGGDFGLDASGRLTGAPPLLTYAGVARLDAALFDGFASGRQPLRPILDVAIARGALRGLRYDGAWVDVGTPERLEHARSLAAATK